ncbi:hypothetical protein LSAT2_013640 [Lamellibrachia satsuma]|nr:hypothetical protein LSAT2_013640 [Lamellibrachia satsuma]
MCSAQKEENNVASSKSCSAIIMPCGDMNRVCNAPCSNRHSCTNTQCVNTDVKVCSAGTNKLPEIGQVKCDSDVERDRIALNEDNAFTQISPSMLNAMLHVADSMSQDPYSVITDKADIDLHVNKSRSDPLCSDWLGCRSHNSPSEIAYKHSSIENVCKTKNNPPGMVHEKTFSKESPNSQTLTNGGCSGGQSHVAKQPESLSIKSKTLSLGSRKSKRFSYPSVKQISSMCPQRVFNLQRNTVEQIEEKSSGTTQLNMSDRSCYSASIISMNIASSDCDKGLAETETREKTAADDAPARMPNWGETVKEKRKGETNPSCLPDIKTIEMGLKSKQEGENSSMGKDSGQSFLQRRDGKPCLRSTSGTHPQSGNKHSFTGFAMASNKAMSVSITALETAQKLVAECDRDNVCCHRNTVSDAKSMPSDKMHHGGCANTRPSNCDKEPTMCHHKEPTMCHHKEPTMCHCKEPTMCQCKEPTICHRKEPTMCHHKEPTMCHYKEPTMCHHKESTMCHHKEPTMCHCKESIMCHHKEPTMCHRKEPTMYQHKEPTMCQHKEPTMCHHKAHGLPVCQWKGH